MEWLRAHPYISALSAAAIIFLVGIYIVQRQVAGPIHSGTSTWEGATSPFLNPTGYATIHSAPGTPQTQENIMQNVTSGPPYTYTPPTTPPTDTNTNSDDSFDFDAFIKTLSSGQNRTTAGTKQAEIDTPAYSFIPSKLMSATSAPDRRTDMEQKLYDYGNEVGSFIQSFEDQHPGVAQILKNQVEDRNDASKAAAVVAIADALKSVGNNLTIIDNVPSQMAVVHVRVAKSYIAIGTNLALVPQAQNDADFLKAIETYNAHADTFVKNYVALAELFGAYGIVFASIDAGSVFTFTPNSL